MKLSARDAASYFRKPDPGKAGLLIYGADPMRIALKRTEVIKALIGDSGEEEMRLTRMPASDLRKDAAPLVDAIKAIGFFPGPRAAFVEDANDQALNAIEAALQDWQSGDAQIIVTAGALKATSKLRKLFEGHANAYAVGIYDDPPSRDEIERMLTDAGLRGVPHDSMTALTDYSRALGPGDFRQMLEKVALYKLGDDTPLSVEDIEASAPASTEAALDDVLNVVAEARVGEIGPVLRKLQAQGTNAVSLCIGTLRHFRTLHAVASDPGGPGAGIGRVRPPIFGPRRDRVLRQAQAWGMHRLEDALVLITDTDLQLRSAGQSAPAMALAERMLIRLAMLGRRR
ncbi:MAG: DNA polymerase III subunit delta [Aestuariivita sp.]|uniref:DNA polymerase III subunit delta n=1 Tax=Aestuariivita sp. TaxID=1872407 RepID=UPI003BAF4387